MKEENATEIAALKDEIKYLQGKIKELKGASVIDGKRLYKICWFRDTALSSHISYIARAAVDGEERKTEKKHRTGVPCYDSPKSVSELTNAQKEAAREVADKIIDILEEVHSRKLWEKNDT